MLDQVLAQAVLMCQNDPNIPTLLASTLCADDFYEGWRYYDIVNNGGERGFAISKCDNSDFKI